MGVKGRLRRLFGIFLVRLGDTTQDSSRYWHGEDKGAALVDHALDPDLALVGLDQPPYNGESEPGAALSRPASKDLNDLIEDISLSVSGRS